MKRIALFLIIWIPRLTPVFVWMAEKKRGSGPQPRRKHTRSSTADKIHKFLWDMIVLYNTEREIRAAGWVKPEDTQPYWSPASHWDEHPIFTVADWQLDVAADHSRQSYVDWVNNRLAEEEICQK